MKEVQILSHPVKYLTFAWILHGRRRRVVKTFQEQWNPVNSLASKQG